MVTVISSKEKSTTPVSNGVTGGSSCDNERPFQFIKDYQEVDFYRTPSCKPLPADLFDTNDGRICKSSIQGMFFLQIDGIKSSINNQNQHAYLLLTLTDGISSIQAVTIQPIANLTLNTKVGSKLLLTNTIAIQNDLLQLTHDNTSFQSGSNTYPRPRPAFRGNRGNRSSYDNRRNPRYDNDGIEISYSKRPPPKNTLMDFLPFNPPSNEIEVDKSKERSDFSHKRLSNRTNPTYHAADNEQNLLEQDGIDEPSDCEDDPTHGNHRERRNPLPPRLQRAQEERSRRTTNRFSDESIALENNHSMSSTLPTHLRHVDQGTYNTYASTLTDSTGTHLNYYSSNPTPFIYNLSTPNYPNHQPLLASSYGNECCYGPGGYGNYLPMNGNGEGKVHSTSENLLSSNGDANDSGMKSESSSNEQKSTPPVGSSLNENQSNSSGGKRRDSNTVKPRWKIGDACFARWSEDEQFYYATIMDIRPPFCTVLFPEYQTYDQVHFSHLKIIPRDQPYYPLVPPSSDLHLLPPTAYYPARPNYYSSTLDGCIIMPEVPPFPFNSAGTLYMYSAPIYPPIIHQTNGGDLTMNSSSSPSKDSNDTSVIDSTATSTDENHQQQPLPSTTTSYPQPCSIADAPLTLVTPDDLSQVDINRVNLNEEQQALTEEEEEEEDVDDDDEIRE